MNGELGPPAEGPGAERGEREGEAASARAAGLAIDRLLDEIWRADGPRGGLPVYALLDGARDEGIVPRVRRSKLDYRCLLTGRLGPAIEAAAPYLVSLGRRSRLTRDLLELGWGRSWGVFVRSSAILQELRRHFRSLLKVRTPDGRERFFRFYDPRVMRSFLPTCDREQLAEVFGPVREFLVEGEAGDTLLSYRRVDGGLERREIDLGV